METLKKQVLRARRRLVLQKFLLVLAWSWFGALLAATLLIAVGKFWPLGVADWQWAVGAISLGLLLAMVWTFITRSAVMDAAIELDRRFGLKERVSSTLSLPASELESPAGQALAADAQKRVEKIHVAERFGVGLSRWSWLPLLPGVAAFLLAMFVEPQSNTNLAQATTDLVAVKKQVKESSDLLRKQILERKKEAREQGLKDAEKIFEKLEKGTKDLAKGDLERKQALVNLNELSKDLAKRRNELASNEKLKQQLNQLKDMKQGPGDKFSQALKEGNLGQAVKELDKLKEQIKMGKLDPEQQKKLADQMGDLQKKLNDMAQDHQKKMQDVQRQMQQKRDAGQNAEADELQQQLQQMQQQAQKMEQMQKLGEKMGECAQCMKEGKADEAEAALSQLQSDLSDLKSQLDEMKMLDEAMDEISMAKEGMKGMGRGMGDRPGDGLGEGRGFGERPEERTDVKFHNSNVKQKQGRGAAVIEGFVNGPNKKGEVQQAIKEQYEASKTEAADPLTGQRLPRDYRDHAKKYFDALREGSK